MKINTTLLEKLINNIPDVDMFSDELRISSSAFATCTICGTSIEAGTPEQTKNDMTDHFNNNHKDLIGKKVQ